MNYTKMKIEWHADGIITLREHSYSKLMQSSGSGVIIILNNQQLNHTAKFDTQYL